VDAVNVYFETQGWIPMSRGEFHDL